MTMAEFQAFMAGFAAFHCPKKGEDAPSEDEFLAALAEAQAAGTA